MKRILALMAAGGALAVGGAASAQSGAENDIEAAIEAAVACRSIAEDGARLSCLDAAAGSLQAARDSLVADNAGKKEGLLARFGLRGGEEKEESENAPKVKEKETVEEFGAEGIFAERHARLDEKLDEINATVTKITINSRKEATLYLDNGQVWRQQSADNKILTTTDKDNAYPVRIKRSTFGSYIALVDGLNRSIRVRRVK